MGQLYSKVSLESQEMSNESVNRISSNRMRLSGIESAPGTAATMQPRRMDWGLSLVILGILSFSQSETMPPQNDQPQASASRARTCRAVTSTSFYSEDIPPMEEEEVGDMRWVRFVTLVDQRGGQYRQRSSTPTAYGGFSDIWQCDAVLSDGSSVVVSHNALCGAAVLS